MSTPPGELSHVSLVYHHQNSFPSANVANFDVDPFSLALAAIVPTWMFGLRLRTHKEKG